MNSKKIIMVVGGILIAMVMLAGFSSCKKESAPVPVEPKNSKIVGNWQISQNAKSWNTSTNSWDSVTLGVEYTSAKWHFNAGVNNGTYSAESIYGFGGNGTWVIDSGNVTITNDQKVDHFKGPITFNTDGSFTVQCTILGTLVQLTFVKI